MVRPGRVLLAALAVLAVAGSVTAAVVRSGDRTDGGTNDTACMATTRFATGDDIGVVFPQRAELPGAGGAVVVSGVVRDMTCAPVSGVQVRFWAAGSDGEYTEDGYGSVYSDADGRYRFESFFPGGYHGVAPHVHVSAYVDGVEVRTEIHPTAGVVDYPLDIVPPARADDGAGNTVSTDQVPVPGGGGVAP